MPSLMRHVKQTMSVEFPLDHFDLSKYLSDEVKSGREMNVETGVPSEMLYRCISVVVCSFILIFILLFRNYQHQHIIIFQCVIKIQNSYTLLYNSEEIFGLEMEVNIIKKRLVKHPFGAHFFVVESLRRSRLWPLHQLHTTSGQQMVFVQ